MKCPLKFGPDGKISRQLTYQRRGLLSSAGKKMD